MRNRRARGKKKVSMYKIYVCVSKRERMRTKKECRKEKEGMRRTEKMVKKRKGSQEKVNMKFPGMDED